MGFVVKFFFDFGGFVGLYGHVLASCIHPGFQGWDVESYHSCTYGMKISLFLFVQT